MKNTLMLKGKSGTFYNPAYYFVSNGLIFCKSKVKKKKPRHYRGLTIIDIASQEAIRNFTTFQGGIQ